jgi:cell fate regulator YaaT (PSP1 superfamily)
MSLEYLLRYGLVGDFSRFRAAAPLAMRRGDRAVVRSHRGVEMAEILREAVAGHAHFLPNTTVGQLLRPASPEDERQAERMDVKAQHLFERGSQLAIELALPIELLDVEVLLDDAHGVLHHVRWGDGDVRPFVSTLSREFELHIQLQDLTAPVTAATHADEGNGCGREGCGKGGCGSCGSGGGCGTCGSAQPAEVQAYFAELRQHMERRTSLL